MIESKTVPDPSDNLLVFQSEALRKEIKDKGLNFLLILENGKEVVLSAQSIDSQMLIETLSSFFKKELCLIQRLKLILRTLF